MTGIGIDSATVNSATMVTSFNNPTTASVSGPSHAKYDGILTVGRHDLKWLEKSTAASTTTWYGDNGLASVTQTGMVVVLLS